MDTKIKADLNEAPALMRAKWMREWCIHLLQEVPDSQLSLLNQKLLEIKTEARKDSLKWGDVCRAKCSAPARYIGNGKCIYISSMGNERGVDDAEPPRGGEETFPLVDDGELKELTERVQRGERI